MPVIAGLMIFIVSVGVAHVVMTWFFRQQERGLERLAAVYLDGISATILPSVIAGDRLTTTQALARTLLFHQGIRERRLIVLTPSGKLFAEVALDGGGDAPPLDAELLQDLNEHRGFVLDFSAATGWVHRRLVRDGEVIADIFAQLDVSELRQERLRLRATLIFGVLLVSGAAALVGSLVIRRIVAPLHLITRRLAAARSGPIEPLPEAALATSTTELRDLVGGFNALAAALAEREALAHELAERERNALLGRMAAAIAHEVRNPLAGMLGALDTIRKFGGDEAIRRRAVSLLERGLASIGDVVGATLASYRLPMAQRRLEPQDFDDLRTLAELEARRRGVRLAWRCAIARGLPIPATELRQVALNLLLNACAATPPGGSVAFAAELDGALLRVTVDDEGPGLPENAAAALLGDETEAGAVRPGVGISVIRTLVRELGGRIEVERRAPQGSRIVLELPVPAAEATDAAA